MSTSWTCDDSTNWNGDCKLIFNLFWYRHIKQVKIGKLVAVHTQTGDTGSFPSNSTVIPRKCFDLIYYLSRLPQPSPTATKLRWI